MKVKLLGYELEYGFGRAKFVEQAFDSHGKPLGDKYGAIYIKNNPYTHLS